jgi:hypothetical protein
MESWIFSRNHDAGVDRLGTCFRGEQRAAVTLPRGALTAALNAGIGPSQS